MSPLLLPSSICQYFNAFYSGVRGISGKNLPPPKALGTEKPLLPGPARHGSPCHLQRPPDEHLFGDSGPGAANAWGLREGLAPCLRWRERDLSSSRGPPSPAGTERSWVPGREAAEDIPRGLPVSSPPRAGNHRGARPPRVPPPRCGGLR